MQQYRKKPFWKHAFTVALAALVLLVCTGCSAEKEKPSSSAGKKAAKPPVSVVAVASTPAEPNIPKSVFSTEPSLRDPFYPNSKRTIVQAPVRQASAPADLPALLQAGLVGITGAGNDRVAILNNVMLERGRDAVIPLPKGQQPQEVKDRCMEIDRNMVTLHVQGYPQPVILRVSPRP